jgi:hypothetical protein
MIGYMAWCSSLRTMLMASVGIGGGYGLYASQNGSSWSQLKYPAGTPSSHIWQRVIAAPDIAKFLAVGSSAIDSPLAMSL